MQMVSPPSETLGRRPSFRPSSARNFEACSQSWTAGLILSTIKMPFYPKPVIIKDLNLGVLYVQINIQ